VGPDCTTVADIARVDALYLSKIPAWRTRKGKAIASGVDTPVSDASSGHTAIGDHNKEFKEERV